MHLLLFQRVYEQHLHGYVVIIYLDDILIYLTIFLSTNSMSRILCRLHTNGLFARADKCKFHITSANTWIYADTWRPHHDPIQSSNHPDWPHHEKSRIFNPSSACISTIVSFMDIPNHSSAYMSYRCMHSNLLWVDMVYNWDSARYYLGSFGPWIEHTLYCYVHNTHVTLLTTSASSEPVTSPVTPLH